ncbi:hypothetical protein SDC9_186484 [bioreactor metagenome]|jgi:hypothetical protein|uniref:Transposase n=1 Tax=bioreactor metagenome TaxID=1076179 RepID=A0A645HL60_9ZZZZ
MAKRNKREKDAFDNIIDQLDFNGVTQEELFGEDGLVKALTSLILNKALQAEMDNYLGYQKNESAGDIIGNRFIILSDAILSISKVLCPRFSY